MRAAAPLIFLALCLPASAQAQSTFQLKAAKTPGGPMPWESPAQLSYLHETGGESSYAVNAAFAAVFNNIAQTTIQPQLTAWVAKNTLTAKQQDKRGIEAAIGMAAGDAHFGYVPQISVSAERDKVKGTDERTYEATVDFISTDLKLGGCGHAATRGCTYWNFMAGLYSNDVRSSDDNTGLGRLSGGRIVVKVTSTPFPESHPLAPIGFSASAQGQWDHNASSMRVKENRRHYVAALAWRFYGENAKLKPSLALQRVLGSDLMTGLSHQAYTQLAFRLEM